jgi:hypothetical protein
MGKGSTSNIQHPEKFKIQALKFLYRIPGGPSIRETNARRVYGISRLDPLGSLVVGSSMDVGGWRLGITLSLDVGC